MINTRGMDKPKLRLNATALNSLPSRAKTLSAPHLGRTKPPVDRFNPVLRGPAAKRLIDKIARPAKPGERRCTCCKVRASGKGALCRWCAWLLE